MERKEWIDGCRRLFTRLVRTTVWADFVFPTGGWATLNFRGNVELTESVALTIEADNLLDKSYRAMDQIDGAGRNLSIFLTATF